MGGWTDEWMDGCILSSFLADKAHTRSRQTHLQVLLPQQLYELGKVLGEKRLGILLALDGGDQWAIGAEENDADVDPLFRRERL